MKNQLLALYFLCLASLSALGQTMDTIKGTHYDKSCEYDGKHYAIGSECKINNQETLVCKAYDAIIPQSANRLEKGYAYWEKQNPATKVSTELPRVLFSTSTPAF
jgi:hypothetical protein